VIVGAGAVTAGLVRREVRRVTGKASWPCHLDRERFFGRAVLHGALDHPADERDTQCLGLERPGTG
jgi:hypothetical protein